MSGAWWLILFHQQGRAPAPRRHLDDALRFDGNEPRMSALLLSSGWLRPPW